MSRRLLRWFFEMSIVATIAVGPLPAVLKTIPSGRTVGVSDRGPYRAAAGWLFEWNRPSPMTSHAFVVHTVRWHGPGFMFAAGTATNTAPSGLRVATAERYRVLYVEPWLPPLLTGALAALSGGLLWRAWWRDRVAGSRRSAGLCGSCGYDLRASVGRCPECGSTTTAPAAK